MSDQDKPKDNSRLLKEILHQLIAGHAGIITASVISHDGLNVASGIPHDDEDDLALIASDLVDTAQEFSQRLEQGHLNRMLLEGEQRTTILMNAGTRTVLVVSVTAGEKLGLVTHAIRHAADQVAEIFD